MNRSSTSRRDMLRTTACGFGSLALAGLCRDSVAAPSMVAKDPHLPPKAKRVIFLFMQGGPSQIDTYDPKPRLDRDDGKQVEFHVARTRKITPERVFKSPWRFRQYGECGQPVSELFPHMAEHVDDYCVIRSMHTEGVAHGPATLFLHTGATNLVRPSMGAWVSYGLGTENQSLPGFVTISPPSTQGGPRLYSNAFLPTLYQGTAIGRAGTGISDGSIANLRNQRWQDDQQRKQLAFLNSLNRQQMLEPDDELEATISSFELAYRMQSEAPAVLDLSSESAATMAQYGIGEQETDEFGRQCLLARRMAESGVRYIQVNYADNTNNPRWDQHSRIKEHEKHARAIDQPVAGLLKDLKQRGLLEDTLVWWGGEFGRTPFAQGRDGRDHNPRGFTVWLAGGGVKPGMAYGQTDEFGYEAVENKVHMHDLHATLLHLMGLNHKQLTYRYDGRDFRLTDVAGRVVTDIIA
ncbi:MAG: sulfatase [Planctomycetaceae bacterium]|nr:sulfatase [Planctomycetaceae bacterium]